MAIDQPGPLGMKMKLDALASVENERDHVLDRFKSEMERGHWIDEERGVQSMLGQLGELVGNANAGGIEGTRQRLLPASTRDIRAPEKLGINGHQRKQALPWPLKYR